MDGCDASAAARAGNGPGGVRCWATSLAQRLVVGPGAQAGTLSRPWATFCLWANSFAREQCRFTFKFSISEAFFTLFFIVLFAVLI
jgi:hypothetical protein